MTREIIDDDDWIEVDRALPAGAEHPDVEVRRSIFHLRGKVLKARAFIVFRREAAKWIGANGPRFRVSIGGNGANFLRIVPDLHAGKFENVPFKGVERMMLGHISTWPNETRQPTEAKWDISRGWMTLELPSDFAIPRPQPRAGASVAGAASMAPTRGAALPFPGDPVPTRSALDQRKATST